MIINNFTEITKYIHFPSYVDVCYRVLIIKRRKDNPNMDIGQKVIREYYIKSKKDLSFLADSIIKKSIEHDARVYIDVKPKSLRNVAHSIISIVNTSIENGNHTSLENIYSKAYGKTKSYKGAKWILDIDEKDLSSVQNLMKNIKTFYQENNLNRKCFYLETLNGYHIITDPFHPILIKGLGIDVIKEGMTLLYYNKKRE